MQNQEGLSMQLGDPGNTALKYYAFALQIALQALGRRREHLVFMGML